MKKDGEIKLLLNERGKGARQKLAAARTRSMFPPAAPPSPVELAAVILAGQRIPMAHDGRRTRCRLRPNRAHR